MRRLLVMALAAAVAGACAHPAPTTPAETTALAVDSAGLIVDVVQAVTDRLDAKPPTSLMVFDLPDGGQLVAEVLRVAVVPPPLAAPAPQSIPSMLGASDGG